MRELIFRGLLIFVFALLQAAVLTDIEFLYLNKLDLLLILTIYFGFKGGVMPGQVTGFISGFLEDTLTNPSAFGLWTLVKTIIGFIAGNLHKRIYTVSYITIFLLIFFGTVVKGFLYVLFIHLFVQSFSGAELLNYITHSLLIEMLLNSLVAPVIFGLLNKFNLVSGERD